MADMDAEYRKILKEEMDRRKRGNKRYSLRRFARLLRCDPTYLSKLNAGKIILSVDRADVFAKLLKLPDSLRRGFVLSAAEEQKCHDLYLVDPAFTDCEASHPHLNRSPASRKR